MYLSIYYFIHIAPEYLLSLQGGRFDHPNRLFHSIAKTWNNVLVDNVDLKEVSMLYIYSTAIYVYIYLTIRH